MLAALLLNHPEDEPSGGWFTSYEDFLRKRYPAEKKRPKKRKRKRKPEHPKPLQAASNSKVELPPIRLVGPAPKAELTKPIRTARRKKRRRDDDDFLLLM